MRSLNSQSRLTERAPCCCGLSFLSFAAKRKEELRTELCFSFHLCVCHLLTFSACQISDQEGLGYTMYQGASKKNRLPRRSFDIQSGNGRDITVQNLHQNSCGAVQSGVSSAETDFASSLKATTGGLPHSFEFYVWSDEGINLHVDLNSSPSDWSNKYRNEVCTSEKVCRKEIGSLWQDISCLRECSKRGKNAFLWNTNSGHTDGQAKPSLSLKLAKDDVTGLDQQIKDSCPLICDSSTPCSMTINVADNEKENQSTVSARLPVNVADCLKEYESTVSAEVSYSIPNNYISGAESCAKDLSKNILDSDATDTPLTKSLCCSVGNSPSDPDTIEHQNSKPDNEISEDYAMPHSSCFLNPGMVCPGVSLSGSMELQISEVASCHKYASLSLCENDGFLNLSDPKSSLDVEEGGLVNSSEINLDPDGKNLPSITEEWVVDEVFDGRESSECSQFDDPHKKSGLESDDQESKMKLRKKKKWTDSDIEGSDVEGSGDKPAAKFLRSMKKTAVTVQPRRSMRLISK